MGDQKGRNILVTNLYNVNDAAYAMERSIRFDLFENIADRSQYKFGGKLALFMPFGTFFVTKAKQDKMKCLF